MMAEGFRSQDVGLRAQKKVLSRMANNRTLVKSVIDDTTGQLLDNLHKLAKNQSGNKKESDKAIKYIIKIVIKIGLLYNHNKFDKDELKLGEDITVKFQTLVKALISSYEKPQNYSRCNLLATMNDLRETLKLLVEKHLTAKSLNSVDRSFTFFDGEFLDAVFDLSYKDRPLVGKIVDDLKKAAKEQWGWQLNI